MIENIKTWQERWNDDFKANPGPKKKSPDAFKDEEIAELRAALATPAVASGALEDERTAFEDDMIDLYPSAKFNRFPSGTYTDSHIETQWGAWQRRAKLAAAAAPNAALVAITEEQLVKAARYLSDFQCGQTGINKDDAWRIYGSSDIELLRAALAQAGAA